MNSLTVLAGEEFGTNIKNDFATREIGARSVIGL
jgi:hypothetical protein